MVTAWRRWRRRWRWVSLLAVTLLRRLTPVMVACRTRRVMARPALVSLVVLPVMTGLLRVVADDNVALLWWGHIRTMVSLVIFAMSGRSGRRRWAMRSGLFYVVGGYGMASFLLRASLRLCSDEPVWDPTSRGDLSLGGLYWLDWQSAGLDSSL